MAIWVTALALEVCASLLLLRKSVWRAYTFLFTYVIWLLVGNLVLLLAFLYSPSVYPTLYWHSDSIDVLLRFLVVWEVFHQTFPTRSRLSRSLSKGLGMIAFALLVFAFATFWVYQSHTGVQYVSDVLSYLRLIHLALDRSFGFVQALMILGTLLLARYYGVSCGRNVRGIALAFGAWVSISTATNAMAGLTNSFLPYWYYLRPLSFVVMIAVWIWALWVYDPNPPILESEPVELGQWTEDWNRTISAARTIIRP
jgi:hypothetical protein